MSQTQDKCHLCNAALAGMKSDLVTLGIRAGIENLNLIESVVDEQPLLMRKCSQAKVKENKHFFSALDSGGQPVRW